MTGIGRAIPIAALVLAAAAAGPARAGDEAAGEAPGWVLTEKHVRLDREDVNVVRLGPGDGYSVLQVVDRGAELLVLAKKDEWYNVRLSDSRTGWVHESLCEEFDDLSGLEFRPNPRLFSRIGSFTLSPYAGGYSYDRKSNAFALGGRLGYYVFDFVEVEGGVSWAHVNRPAEIVESLFGLSLEAEEFHMLFYELNGNVMLLPGRQLVPYLTAGAGSNIQRGETETSVNWGGGIRFFVTKQTAFRWEFRTYRFESGVGTSRRSNTNFAFNVGTTILL
jgi:outer membrane beta-barrel protein